MDLHEATVCVVFGLSLLTLVLTVLAICGGKKKEAKDAKPGNKPAGKTSDQKSFMTMTGMSEDPDLKSRDNYDLKTAEDKPHGDKTVEKTVGGETAYDEPRSKLAPVDGKK